ncbi:MAG: peroxidase [Planctomycetota bacterium]
MAFIDLIQPEQAAGKLKMLYDAAMKRAGYVANIIKIMCHDPDSCNSSMAFYGTLMKMPNALTGAQKEMLATVVSNANDCFY